MWDAFQWSSATQMKYLRTFAFSIGKRYQDLIPDADWVSPNKTQTTQGYEGWAYAAHTADKEIILAYFENGCPQSILRAVKPSSTYRAEWFDPREGEWIDAGEGFVQSSAIGSDCASPFPRRYRLGAATAIRRSSPVRVRTLMLDAARTLCLKVSSLG